MAARDPFRFPDEVFMLLDGIRGRMATRNRALLAFGCGTGFRGKEILSIRRYDVIDERGRLRDKIRVHKTKNKKSRTVPLCDFAKDFLREWLKEQAEKHGLGRVDRYVFTQINGTVLTPKYIGEVIKRLAGRYELHGQHFGAHSMRKTFAQVMYEYYCGSCKESGNPDPLAPVRMLQKVMGHSSINVTISYIDFILGEYQAGVLQAFCRHLRFIQEGKEVKRRKWRKK